MSLLLISRRRYSGVEATPLDLTLADDLNNLDDAFDSEIGIHFHVNLEDDLNSFGDALVKQGQHFLPELGDDLNNWLDAINVNLAAGGSDIVMDGLVAWYKFDDGSGDVLTDYSGNANHGQLGSTVGSDTNDPTWATDNGESVLTFDGSDNQVLIGPLNFTGDVSVIFVGKKTLGTTNATFVADSDDYRIIITTETNLRGACGSSTIVSITVVDSDSANFHMYCMRFDRATKLNLIRDNFELSGTDNVVADSDSVFSYIGRQGTLRPLAGSIAYMLFYNKYLSDAEVTQNYNAIKAEKPGLSLP